MFSNLHAMTAPAAAGGAAAPAGPLGMIGSFLPFILMFGVFYFLMIRPQQKKQKVTRAMLENLKKNDEIITSGGIFGKVISINTQDDIVQIKIDEANNINMKIRRAAIVGVINGENK